MQLINAHEQPPGCRHCRHYYHLQPKERFPYGCLAMAYIGKQPADRIVLTPGDGPCPLFAPGQRTVR